MTTRPKPTPAPRWSNSGSTRSSTATAHSCSPYAATTSPTSTNEPTPRSKPEGAVGPDALVVDGRAFGVGDWVMTLTNDYPLGVLNGQRGAIVAIDPRRRAVHVTFDDNTTKTIPAAYLDAGGLDHAYAMTIHKAQGQTCDYAYVLGDEHLYREAGYSALTRGRHENHLYTADAELDPEAHAHDEPEDGSATVLRSLDRSRQQELAIKQALEAPSAYAETRPASTHDLDAGIEL